MDVLEFSPNVETPAVICDYEIKTGGALLEYPQMHKYGISLTTRHPGAIIYYFQVKPRK